MKYPKRFLSKVIQEYLSVAFLKDELQRNFKYSWCSVVDRICKEDYFVENRIKTFPSVQNL